MIKVLVVDHNEVSRRALRNILKDEFHFAVVEAADGIEGIDKFAKSLPDIVIIDSDVPYMNGAEFLEAMKSDPQFRDLFVIAMTAKNNKASLNAMVSLGINDVLFKPFDTSEVIAKIRNITTKYSEVLRQNIIVKKLLTADPAERKTILLTDRDDYFREYFKNIFSDRFQIYYAKNGAECLNMFMKYKPQIVCLGENLPFINEKLLARKLQQLDGNFRAEIFLMAARKTENETNNGYFDDIVLKSYDPEEFLIEFSRKVLRNEGLFDMILGMISNLDSEINHAVKSSFKNIASEEVTTLDLIEVGSIPTELSAITSLVERRESVRITVMITGSQTDIASITKKIFGADYSYDKGVIAAFGDLLTNISKNLQSTLSRKGIHTELEQVTVKFAPEEFQMATYKFLHPFETEKHRRFLLAILLTKQ